MNPISATIYTAMGKSFDFILQGFFFIFYFFILKMRATMKKFNFAQRVVWPLPNYWRLSVSPWNVLPDKMSLFTQGLWALPEGLLMWFMVMLSSMLLVWPLKGLETDVSYVDSQWWSPSKDSRVQASIPGWQCSMYTVTHHYQEELTPPTTPQRGPVEAWDPPRVGSMHLFPWLIFNFYFILAHSWLTMLC